MKLLSLCCVYSQFVESVNLTADDSYLATFLESRKKCWQNHDLQDKVRNLRNVE